MKKYHVIRMESERTQIKAVIAKRKADSQAVKRVYVLLAAARKPAKLVKR